MLARLAVLAALAASTACLTPEETTCADGFVCPAGYGCVPGGGGCALVPDLESCDQLADGTICENELRTGLCRLGVCVVPRCGDGITDVAAGEVCDDGVGDSGLPEDGDGCSAQCDSDESCGNGVPDFARGEQCDAGPGLSQDGCASSCQVELPAWQGATADALPPLLVAYDAGRARVIGLRLAPDGGEQWSWDGTGWQRLAEIGPNVDGTLGARLVYDATHDVLVLVATVNAPAPDGSPGVGNQVWLHDADGWRQGPDLPVGRLQPALAFDPAGDGSVVLHGGYTLRDGGEIDEVLGDTWRLTEAGWAQIGTINQPAVYFHELAYDEVSDRLLLVGGQQGTWALDNDDWLDTGAGAPGVLGPITIDPMAGELLAIGGLEIVNGVGAFTRATAWRLHAGTWARDASADLPIAGPRVARTNALVTAADALLAITPAVLDDHGTGDGGSLAVQTSQTWRLDAGGWTIVDDLRPPDLGGVRLVTLGAQSMVLAVSVGIPDLLLDDSTRLRTWRLDRDGRWRRVITTDAPSARSAPAVAVDESRGQLILRGGAISTGGPPDDLWSFDGATWTALSASGVAPAANEELAMATDPTTDTLVAVTGAGETYQLDLARLAWSGPLGPPLELVAGVQLAYDRGRSAIVLTGTSSDGSPDLVTLRWNGTAWMELDRAPWAPRPDATLVWEPGRRELQLVGGANDVLALGAADSTWRDVTTVNAGPGVSYGSATYDPLGLRVVFAQPEPEPTLAAVGYVNGAAPPDRCGRVDTDDDGLIGCDDPDCWGRCTPGCPPGEVACTPTTSCGDGTCDERLEDAALCPADC